MSVLEKLREAIGATLKVSPEAITETTKNKDLAEWDSLGHLNVMMALEQTFGVALDVEDFDRLTSIPKIIEYLRGHGIQ